MYEKHGNFNYYKISAIKSSLSGFKDQFLNFHLYPKGDYKIGLGNFKPKLKNIFIKSLEDYENEKHKVGNILPLLEKHYPK